MHSSVWPSHRPARVSIIGAGKVGSTLAQRIVEKNIADVVLLDVVPGLAEGIALDLMQARGIERCDRAFLVRSAYRCVFGTNNYADTAESNVVVITAGSPRKPGMSRDDLLQVNATIVVEAAKNAIAHSPDAILLVVTNPLDVMTYLAWQASGLPPQRVVGMAGGLDSARFQAFIAMELGVPTVDVSAMVLGSHGDLMVPLPRYCTVSGIPITELMDNETIERLVERTRNAGSEIVQLLQTGGAYFAPAATTCLMVESILFNQSRFMPASAYLQGEYGLKDIFIGVPCRLGSSGVESVLELNLTETERAALHASAQSVLKNIQRANEIMSESQSTTRLLLALWKLGAHKSTDVKRVDLTEKIKRTGEKASDYQGIFDKLEQEGAIAFEIKNRNRVILLTEKGVQMLRELLNTDEF
ncbi:MAG TPA: malate dehydrogenase [Cyanobacteria bacterium UBA11369]|nr:malate dehydrogenase [Cyanobacteria bacterium UBA11371]HBE52083.1 malate dehydrogenase [Cyanobacteria bacterium UBA11369]